MDTIRAFVLNVCKLSFFGGRSVLFGRLLPINAARFRIAMIKLESVEKTYPPGHTALRGVSLEIEEGITLALLGPSGCGKTTTLKLINRLIEPSAGRVLVNGQDVTTLDVVRLRRGIGYVVQEAGLFPHMTAAANVEALPRLLGWPRDRRRARVRELFALMDLDFDGLGVRYPSQLSGGQRQRVGLARALAADPPIVLMDEPFGALDPLTRRRLHAEFLVLQKRLQKTVVLVTHDIEEACLLADRVAVLSHGQIVQLGSPDEIRANPASAFISEFLGLEGPGRGTVGASPAPPTGRSSR
jgi:osmoprotectant transport system ATP-binding protein